MVDVNVVQTKLASLLDELDTSGVPVYVTQHGKPKAVLVKYEDYEALLEKLDDLEDILAMKEALAGPPEEAITLEEYERQRASQ